MFVGVLQAYIFVLLTMMYVAGAVAEEHYLNKFRHSREASRPPAWNATTSERRFY